MKNNEQINHHHHRFGHYVRKVYTGLEPTDTSCIVTNHERVSAMNEKDRYKEQLEPLIDNWNAEFDKLEAKMKMAGADPTADYDEVILALRQHRNKTKLHLK